MQILDRCDHDPEITQSDPFAFALARLAVKWKLSRGLSLSDHQFFYPPIQKERTTLVPLILRKEILAARREPGSHVLVYQTAGADESLIETLQTILGDFRLYGLNSAGKERRRT